MDALPQGVPLLLELREEFGEMSFVQNRCRNEVGRGRRTLEVCGGFRIRDLIPEGVERFILFKVRRDAEVLDEKQSVDQGGLFCFGDLKISHTVIIHAHPTPASNLVPLCQLSTGS